MSLNEDSVSQPTLRLEAVSKTFPALRKRLLEDKKSALNNFSLSISRGELVWVHGSNGAGKSTFLRVAAGLLDPDQGLVEYGFNTLQQGSVLWFTTNCFGRVGISSIQLVSYVLALTGQSQIKESGIRACFKNRCHEAGLSDSDLQASFATLSTGQQQIVKLALFTSLPAKLFLFDEPFSGMSSKAIGVAHSWIHRELEGAQSTFIILSHDDTLATKANRVVEIESGSVVSNQMRESPRFDGPDQNESPVFAASRLRCVLGLLEKNLFTSKRFLKWTIFAWVQSVFITISTLLVAVFVGSGEQLNVVFVGIVVWNFLGSLLLGLTANLDLERYDGTLEFLMSQKNSKACLLIAQSFWALASSGLQGVVTYTTLRIFSDIPIVILNWQGFLGVLLVSSLLFLSIGILLGSLTLLNRFGSGVVNGISGLLLFTSGAYYSTDVLPSFFAVLAENNPVALCFTAARVALGVEQGELFDLLARIGTLSVFFLFISLKAFSMAQRWAKKRGNLIL